MERIISGKNMLILLTLTLNVCVTYGLIPCPTVCKCQANILHCNGGKAPTRVPNDTEEVHITGFQPTQSGDQPFSHPSWSNVHKLELNLQYPSNIKYIANNVFLGLTQLEYLGIHGINSPNISSEINMYYYTFQGLDNLTTLNFSGNPSLNLLEITKSLKVKWILPKLRTMTITGLQSLDSEPISMYHMNDFVYTLPPRPVKTLIMDKINMEIDLLNMRQLCKTVEQLLIRNAYIGSVYNQQNFVCLNLKVLDLTNSTVPFLQALMKIRFPPSAGHVDNFNKFYSFVFTPETVKLDNIIPAIPTPLTFTDGWVYESTGTKFRVKYLNFRQNHMVSLNVSFKNIPFLPGSEIDTSENELEFIHPRCIDPGKNIRKINVSKNKLYKMEQNQPQQFRQFLQIFINLEHIDISSNGLSSIPYDMFQQNVKLQRINLANNNLKTIHFDLESLKHLHCIDLRNNMLFNLDEKITRQIDTLSRIKTENFTVALGGNNFKCDCHEFKFVSWIKNSRFLKGEDYQCSFNGRIYDLKANGINEVKQVCQNQLIRKISLIVSSVVACIICILIIIFILFRRHKKRQSNIRKILEQLKRNHQDFLVFLSYCSEDASFVNDHLYHQLNEEICRRVGKRRTYVCKDEDNFKLGFPIITEIMTNIEKSCVVLCVTSQAFCSKTWCQMEVEEAYNLQKPIILMIKDEIDVAHLPKLMSRLFQRNTRGKVSRGKDGKYEIHPPWTVLCSSILDLAAGSNAQTDLETELFGRNSMVQSTKDGRNSMVQSTKDGRNSMVQSTKDAQPSVSFTNSSKENNNRVPVSITDSSREKDNNLPISETIHEE